VLLLFAGVGAGYLAAYFLDPEQGRGGRLVAAGDCFFDLLQRGAQRGLEARVVLTPHFRLPCALPRLGGVCHVRESLIGAAEKDRA
jgi:hypothetical protein